MHHIIVWDAGFEPGTPVPEATIYMYTLILSKYPCNLTICKLFEFFSIWHSVKNCTFYLLKVCCSIVSGKMQELSSVKHNLNRPSFKYSIRREKKIKLPSRAGYQLWRISSRTNIRLFRQKGYRISGYPDVLTYMHNVCCSPPLHQATWLGMPGLGNQ